MKRENRKMKSSKKYYQLLLEVGCNFTNGWGQYIQFPSGNFIEIGRFNTRKAALEKMYSLQGPSNYGYYKVVRVKEP